MLTACLLRFLVCSLFSLSRTLVLARSVNVPARRCPHRRKGDRPQVPRKRNILGARAATGDRGGRQPVAGPVEQQLRRGDFLLRRLQPGDYRHLEVRGSQKCVEIFNRKLSLVHTPCLPCFNPTAAVHVLPSSTLR